MALQAWVGRSGAQLDADSPLDITLHNSYDDDLIHLRQVSYGDGAGGFLTPIDGHRHNGSDSQLAPPIINAPTESNTALGAGANLTPSPGEWWSGVHESGTGNMAFETFLNGAWKRAVVTSESIFLIPVGVNTDNRLVETTGTDATTVYINEVFD